MTLPDLTLSLTKINRIKCVEIDLGYFWNFWNVSVIDRLKVRVRARVKVRIRVKVVFRNIISPIIRVGGVRGEEDGAGGVAGAANYRVSPKPER